MPIKILSWNIWGGKYLDGVIDFLKSANADIIALQEVVENESENMTATIANALGYEYVSAVGMRMKGTIRFGNAILSKYKIVGHKDHDLSPEKSRLAIQADIEIQNSVFQAFSIHLKHTHQKPSELQDTQADNLIKIISREKTIVMGDFNALPESNAVRKLEQVMNNADGVSHLPTWSVYPEGCETCLPQNIGQTLDYIFTSRDLGVTSYTASSSKNSDHLPISAIIEI